MVPRIVQPGSKYPSTPILKSSDARVRADALAGTLCRRDVPWNATARPGRAPSAGSNDPGPVAVVSAVSTSRVTPVRSGSVSGIQKLISPSWWPYSASRCALALPRASLRLLPPARRDRAETEPRLRPRGAAAALGRRPRRAGALAGGGRGGAAAPARRRGLLRRGGVNSFPRMHFRCCKIYYSADPPEELYFHDRSGNSSSRVLVF